MSKRTERMSRSAAERINRKDTVIRQNNAELEELRSQYENLDICEEDKQVIDDYIACKDARADRMAEKLYEKGRKDVKRCIRIRKLIRRCMILSAIVTVVLVQYNKNENRVAFIEQVALADNAPVALLQVGRPPGSIKMMCGHQTFLDVHASAHLAGGAEQDTNMAGIHVGKEFCLADVGVGLMDEGDFFRRNPQRDKFASYVVIDGKL